MATSKLDDIVEPETKVEVLAEGFFSGEGPVWFAEEQRLIFSEVGTKPTPTGWDVMHMGRRHAWDPRTRSTSVVQEVTNMGNGMTRDPQGRLVVCEVAKSRMTRQERDGSYTVLATDYRGLRLTAPNDVVVKSDGAVYFTDTAGGHPGRDLDFSAVYRIAPDLSSINRVATDLQMANGLAFSPDEKILYINDSQGVRADNDTFYSDGNIYAYDVRPSGMLANRRVFAELCGDLSGMPDGMKCDEAGNVYCTGPGGIWVFDPAGTRLGVILTDVRHNETDCTNLAWGGEDWRTLFITTSSSLLSVRTKIPGVRVPTGQGA